METFGWSGCSEEKTFGWFGCSKALRKSRLPHTFSDVVSSKGRYDLHQIQGIECNGSDLEAEDWAYAIADQAVGSEVQCRTSKTLVVLLVHPFLRILFLTVKHPLVLMHDTCDSLNDLVYCPGLKDVSILKRRAFLTQIELGALSRSEESEPRPRSSWTLVKLPVSSKDILPPGIVVRCGRFFLIIWWLFLVVGIELAICQ